MIILLLILNWTGKYINLSWALLSFLHLYFIYFVVNNFNKQLRKWLFRCYTSVNDKKNLTRTQNVSFVINSRLMSDLLILKLKIVKDWILWILILQTKDNFILDHGISKNFDISRYFIKMWPTEVKVLKIGLTLDFIILNFKS